ncbi:MAG: cell division protein FtsA [Verrucomicrobiota bacterium]|nr:cell division protein FtsA [Verrucomicrobiota bacterium]
MALPPVVALEIGTTKTIALVGEMREDGHIIITGIGEHPSIGVRKGEFVDLENAVSCVRGALTMAEDNSGVVIRQVYLAVSGGHIHSVVNRGAVPLPGADRVVTDEDVEQVMGVAQAVNLPPDREILHTICQLFTIDDQERVVRPEGMAAARLGLDMLVLHGVRNRLHNAVRVVRSIPMDVADVVFGGLCSALSVLTPEQKRLGVIVIDLGGGTTDYLAYAGNVVAAGGALGVGGDHVTNDVAVAFSTPTSQAERLKRESGCAVVRPLVGSQRVDLSADVGFQGRSVSLKSLHTVIHARMDEILGMIRRRLEREGILPRVGAGVVLAGGAARLDGVAELAEQVFDMPCSVGRPRNISGLATATDGPEYATVSGLIQYAFKTMTEDDEGRAGILKSLLRMFGR